VSDLWRVAKADGELYRDKQDERDGQDEPDGQDTVRLIRSINFRPLGGFPVWGRSAWYQIKRRGPRLVINYAEDAIALSPSVLFAFTNLKYNSAVGYLPEAQ